MRLSFILSTFAVVCAAKAYRILGVFPLPVKSHWVMFETVMKELATKGHQVDVVSPFPLQHPTENYKDITVESNILVGRTDITVDLAFTLTAITSTTNVPTLGGNDLCEQLKDQPLKDLICNAPRDAYDIVITEMFGANCYLAFGHHFDAPVVAMTSSVMLPWGDEAMGNVDNPSYVPNYMLSFRGHINFRQRLINALFNRYSKISFKLLTQKQDEVLKEAFGQDVPSVRELETRIDLLLVNSHFSLNGVRPFTTGVVEVGGLHIRDDDEDLPLELRKWMDESEAGVVYFSMGSMLRTETFSPEVIAAVYSSFSKLAPTRVLWKAVKKELPPDLPQNVLAMEWIPQRLLLKHKNLKAFITHGGLMSVQEAIHAGIPLIGIAMFYDQALNIGNCVDKKMAVSIDKHSITEESLDFALNAILKNPMYRENAQKVSKQFRDRPHSALDTAVWWIEYIGRNGKGALRSPALDLSWWQVELLDVYGFLLLATLLSVFIIRFVVRRLLFLFSKNAHISSKKIK